MLHHLHSLYYKLQGTVYSNVRNHCSTVYFLVQDVQIIAVLSKITNFAKNYPLSYNLLKYSITENIFSELAGNGFIITLISMTEVFDNLRCQ